MHLPSNTDQFTKQKINRLSGLAGDKPTKPVKNFGYFPDEDGSATDGNSMPAGEPVHRPCSLIH